MIFLTYLDPVRIFSAIQPDQGHVQPQLLCAFIYGFLSPPKAVSGTRSEFLSGHATRSLTSLRMNALFVNRIKKLGYNFTQHEGLG